MVRWFFQRRFDIVFHTICCCNRKILDIHFTIRLTFFESCQPFKYFFMLSSKIVIFFVLLFCIFIYFYIFRRVLVDCILLFDVCFTGRIFKKNFCTCGFAAVVAADLDNVIMVVAALLLTSTVRTDTFFIFSSWPSIS